MTRRTQAWILEGRLPLVRGPSSSTLKLGQRDPAWPRIKNSCLFTTSHTGLSQSRRRRQRMSRVGGAALGSNLLPQSDRSPRPAVRGPKIGLTFNPARAKRRSLGGTWTGTETCFSQRPRSAVNDSESNQQRLFLFGRSRLAVRLSEERRFIRRPGDGDQSGTSRNSSGSRLLPRTAGSSIWTRLFPRTPRRRRDSRPVRSIAVWVIS